jgi:Mn-dependent DtxR family transcriptional regulator
MKRKEAVIRYLALVGRANLYQIAAYIVASSSTVSSRLTELKRSGLVHNIKWSDGSKVWVLTPEGYRRHDYYQLRDKKQEV